MATSQTKALIWWLAGIVGTVALIWGLAQLGAGPSTADQTAVLTINADDHVRGAAQAKVTLVEYSDFQCPACGYYYPLIKQAETQAGDQFRIVYRNYPLRQLHQYAQLGAQAAEAASLQGKFWDMHDLLFERQNTWPTAGDVKATLIGYAGELKLDVAKFTSDLESAAVIARVQRDVDSGDKLNLQGTPTLYLNGKQFATPFTADSLIKAIQAAAK